MVSKRERSFWREQSVGKHRDYAIRNDNDSRTSTVIGRSGCQPKTEQHVAPQDERIPLSEHLLDKTRFLCPEQAEIEPQQ